MKDKKTQKKFKIGPMEKEVLKAVGLGVVLAAAFVMPNIAQILQPLLKDKYRHKRVIKSLERKGWIHLSGDEVVLSKRGEKLLQDMSVEEIEFDKENWDGIWRVVVYDIPNEMKKERDYFRSVLQRLGFITIQKSMFAIPWECREEIAAIAHNLKISRFVIHLTTDHLPKMEKIEESIRNVD